jgi:hypothetical protein
MQSDRGREVRRAMLPTREVPGVSCRKTIPKQVQQIGEWGDYEIDRAG